MTPEDVESRLRSLRTPAPPERLRERCLSSQSRGGRPRAALAVAASFLVFALAAWLITTGREPSRTPDKILPPADDPSPFADDRVLKEKADRLLRQNPGKGVLVIRVKELRDGTYLPVTRGFNLKILLEPAEEEPDPLKYPGGPRADVDLDGTMLFVTQPGKYRGVGYENAPDPELKKLHFVWEYKDVDLKPGGVLLLVDALFAPWMEWSGPAEGSEVSLKAEPRISWKACPEVRRLKFFVERVTKHPDGVTSWEELRALNLERPKDDALPLAELLKISRLPIGAGTTLAVTVTGTDDQGRVISGVKEKRLFTLRE